MKIRLTHVGSVTGILFSMFRIRIFSLYTITFTIHSKRFIQKPFYWDLTLIFKYSRNCFRNLQDALRGRFNQSD